MNYKFLSYTLFFLIMIGCNQHSNNRSIDFIPVKKFKNSGFALIYNDEIKKKKVISKKLDDRSLLIFHSTLDKNTLVKITNPFNQKSIIAKVSSNKVKFPEFYNSVISARIAEELLLNSEEPYIEIILISPNSTFVAKKAKTFDEEINVAQKAPVDGISIDNLDTSKNKLENEDKIIFQYFIKIADFYYMNSAKNMILRIKNETNLKDPLIKKITNTKYRVLLGPFDDIKKLEKSFNKIKKLNFENLEIVKDV